MHTYSRSNIQMKIHACIFAETLKCQYIIVHKSKPTQQRNTLVNIHKHTQKGPANAITVPSCFPLKSAQRQSNLKKHFFFHT